MKQWTICLLMVPAMVQVSWSQTNARDLEKVLKNKPLELRNYSADPVAGYSWANGKLVSDPVELHALGTFEAKSVKIKNGLVIIKGQRAIFVRNATSGQQELSVTEPMQLKINLHGAAPKNMLPQLQDMLFFPDDQSATAGMPEPFAKLPPFSINGPGAPSCHCNYVQDGGKWISVPNPSRNYTPPKLIFLVDPEFTQEARRAKVSGSVDLWFYVSDTGKPSEIWLANPIGFGLDETASKAVRQYSFSPRSMTGTP